MLRKNKNYLIFFLSIFTIFSFCLKKNFYFIGGTDYVWGALPTEIFFFYKNNFFFLDYWDHNNLGQPLLSHGYVPIYSFDRLIYFIFSKVNFLYLNNIYFFIKIFFCFYLVNKICEKINIFKPLIILCSYIFFFSGFVFYNIIFQSSFSQIIFFLIMIYSLILFFQSRNIKYLILLLISFFLFSSSGLLDDSFNVFLLIIYFFLYQFIFKKINFKELILLLIAIFPGGLFIFSNLMPFYIEASSTDFIFNNNLRNVILATSNLDFFKDFSYLTRIFSFLLTGFYDPYSAYFGVNKSHVHGSYPHFFSSFIFFFLIFLIFSNNKNRFIKIFLFLLIILSALPRSALGYFFDFFLHKDPSIYLYFVGILPFLLAPSKLDVKKFFSKFNFILLNKIIFLKNLLILIIFILILFYYYPSKALISFFLESVRPEFFFDPSIHYEMVIKFYIIFSIILFILFYIILFSSNKNKFNFFNIFFIAIFCIYSFVIIYFNNSKNFASNISIYEILTVYTFAYIFFLKFFLKKYINTKTFFILFFLYCFFFSLICFLYNFPNYYSSYLTLPYNFGLKRSFFLVVLFGFFLLISNLELITNLFRKYLNKEIKLSYFFEVIKLFLFIEIIFISFLYLSITKFPFHYIKDKNFLQNDLKSNFYSHRTNYSSNYVNDFSLNSGAHKEIINNTNIIYNHNSSVGGYWLSYGKYSQDLKKSFNLNIYKNYIENINLQKLFGLRFYFDDDSNLKDVSYEVNSRFKIFYKELVIQDDLEKIEYIKNNFSTDLALVGKKNINSISSKNSESINPHYISNKKIIFNLPPSIDERIFLFNDNFTKSWKANINGISSDIFRLNYFAMGTKIPSNQNIVLELTYDPIWSNVHRFTLILSFISLLFVFCFLFLVNKYRYKY